MTAPQTLHIDSNAAFSKHAPIVIASRDHFIHHRVKLSWYVGNGELLGEKMTIFPTNETQCRERYLGATPRS